MQPPSALPVSALPRYRIAPSAQALSHRPRNDVFQEVEGELMSAIVCTARQRPTPRSIAGATLTLALAFGAPVADAATSGCGLPTSGCTAPGWEKVDQAAAAFLCERGIAAGVFGVLHHRKVVVRPAYGWHDEAESRPLTPDALLRIASLSKPFTAAAVRELIADGQLELDERAFDVGQPGGGALAVAAFPQLADARAGEITIDHLLRHRGGWDRDAVGDPTFRELEIRAAMGLASLPSRAATLDYILGQPLQFAPGSRAAYANVGFLALGLIVEARSGGSLASAIQSRVLDPIGVADAEHQAGRTFRADQDAREPWYRDPSTAVNVFDPDGPPVSLPFGAWNHEARLGQGGQIASLDALLAFLRHRNVSGSAIGSARAAIEPGSHRASHTGSLPGSNALLRQRGDGYDYAAAFTSRPASGSSYAAQWLTAMDALINAGQVPIAAGAPACGDAVMGDGFEF